MILAEADASIVGLIGLVVTTVGAIILALIKKETKATKITTEANNRHLEEINKAVNHVRAGEPTLIERVTQQGRDAEEVKANLASYQLWVSKSLQLIASTLGVPIQPYKVTPYIHNKAEKFDNQTQEENNYNEPN